MLFSLEMMTSDIASYISIIVSSDESDLKKQKLFNKSIYWN